MQDFVIVSDMVAYRNRSLGHSKRRGPADKRLIAARKPTFNASNLFEPASAVTVGRETQLNCCMRPRCLRRKRIVRRLFGIAMLIFGVAAIINAGSASAAGALDDTATSAMQKLIHDYILDHPEVIAESMQKLQARQQQEDEQRRREASGAVAPVEPADHIRGDPNAPVKLIEFSDFECPFCKGFHETLTKIMSKYGKSGKVAWVYRHFPIDELHPKARKEAQAAECAAEQGGNDAFWAYADKVFDVTPSNNRLDLALLPKFAVEIGLDQAKFETCLKGNVRGGKYADHIEANFQDASAAGGSGTPYTIVMGPDGSTYPINGALPYSAVKSIIDLALEKK